MAFRDLIFGGGFWLHLHPIYFPNYVFSWLQFSMATSKNTQNNFFSAHKWESNKCISNDVLPLFFFRVTVLWAAE